MESSLLTELRNRLSDGDDLIDKLASQLSSMDERVDELLRSNSDSEDRVRHMNHALRMIAKIQPTSEGATMAMGIAEEALSAVGVD